MGRGMRFHFVRDRAVSWNILSSRGSCTQCGLFHTATVVHAAWVCDSRVGVLLGSGCIFVKSLRGIWPCQIDLGADDWRRWVWRREGNMERQPWWSHWRGNVGDCSGQHGGWRWLLWAMSHGFVWGSPWRTWSGWRVEKLAHEAPRAREWWRGWL